MRRHFHFRQDVKGAEHQLRQLVLTDQAVDPLRQILDPHVAVEVGIFGVQIRQHIFHPQIEIVGAFKLGQAAQQPHRPGFINTDAEQEQQVVGARFFHHHAPLVEELRHQRRRDPLFIHIPLLVHARRQNGDLHRIEIHMIRIGIFETVPVLARRYRPALGFIHGFRLPDIKEPAVRLLAQSLHLFAEVQRPLNGALDQTFTGVTAQHRRRGLNRRDDGVARRRRGMHHKGFIKGLFIIVALNVDQRGLRQRGQHLMRRLRLEDDFPGDPLTAHAAFPLIYRMEMGIGHPGGIEMDRRDIERLLKPGGVIEQTIVGGVGDHRMHGPLRPARVAHFLLNAVAGKFAPGDTAEDPQRVAGRLQPQGNHIAHHQQVGQRFVTVTVNQQGAAGGRRVHADNFIGRRGAVGHHIALLGAKGARDILLRLQVRAGMIQQGAQLGDRNRDIRLQRIPAKKIIEQAAHRAFLIGAAAHMARRTEGIFSLLDIVEQRAGKRRSDILQVLAGVLPNAGGDLFGESQRIFEEPQRHAQILTADIHRRVGVNKGVQRKIFIELIDIAAQIDAVLIPVEDHPADARVVLDKLQQVGAVLRPDGLEALALQRRFQFFDRLVFVVDAVRPHDGDDIHAFLLVFT